MQKKKHNINISLIAFHNYKIKCTQNQTPAVSVLLQSIIATLSYKIMMNEIFAYSCMFVKIGTLIKQYFIINIVTHKNEEKKHYINIAFHNFKIKCTQNQSSVVSVLLQSIIATILA